MGHEAEQLGGCFPRHSPYKRCWHQGYFGGLWEESRKRAWGESIHIVLPQRPCLSFGFSKTEECLGFFSQDGEPTISPLVHHRILHANASVLRDPYPLRFENLRPQSPQIPRDPPSVALLTPRHPNLSPPTHPTSSSPPSLPYYGVSIMSPLYLWGPVSPNSLCTASSRVTCPCRYGRCMVAR